MNTISKAAWLDRRNADALERRAAAHYAVLEANFLTRGLWAGQPEHDRLVASIDRAVVALAVGKWFLGRATGDIGGLAKRSGDAADFARAAEAFDDASRIAEAAIAGRSHEAEARYATAARAGTDIRWCQDIPIVPSIAPIVVLRGSSRQMGEQYMRQVIGIFDRFIFDGFSSRGFGRAQIQTIDRWAEELRRHAPETLDSRAA